MYGYLNESDANLKGEIGEVIAKHYLKEAIFTKQFTCTILKNFNLNKEQISEVTKIIRDILLGDASLNSMPSLISSKLNIDQSTSVQIANKIVNELFGPAIEDIKKLQTPKFPEKISSPVAPMQPLTPRIPEKPDLKIEPDINRNNVVDLRNK